MVPSTATKPPKPPAGLLASSIRRWEALWDSPVSKAIDVSADSHRLERWIQAVDEYDRTNKVFRRARLVKGSTGQPRLNPLSSYLAQLSAEIHRAETELGLTPMARLRLGVAYGQAQLTAAELNAALSIEPASEPEPWEAEWSKAE